MQARRGDRVAKKSQNMLSGRELPSPSSPGPDAWRRGGAALMLRCPLRVPQGADRAAGRPGLGVLALPPRGLASPPGLDGGLVAPCGVLPRRRDRVLPRSSAGRHDELVRVALEEVPEGAQASLVALHPVGDPELVRGAAGLPEQLLDLADRGLDAEVARLRLLLHGVPREARPAPGRVAGRVPDEAPRDRRDGLVHVQEEGPVVAPPDQACLALIPHGEGHAPARGISADALPVGLAVEFELVGLLLGADPDSRQGPLDVGELGLRAVGEHLRVRAVGADVRVGRARGVARGGRLQALG
mmetsp:Transcript_60216/g.176736  ORF Transcript_60216/g.176736 Transcript_60216/m.176736 type:complete len:300 (+) Transcript_60216:169-1068(+)